ncbi:MAG: HlyD family efflux transporter periplasmic adaptor subunit [Hyphomonadaceae bacterium]|nr:HlyD family efflux transporter periplasmic adaptor subunit [Hyphomonadaceae bacterium]
MADDIRFQPMEGEPVSDVLTQGHDAREKAMRLLKKRKLLLLGLGGVVAKFAIAGGAYWLFAASNTVSTDNAYVGASTAQINAQVSGQIQDVSVEDTDVVRVGALLAQIDPADARLAYERAAADYQRTLQRVRQYFAQEASAAAQVRAREADLARARADYNRRRELAATGAISAEELTATRSAFEAAQANLAAAQENLSAQRALTHGATVENHPEAASARAAMETAQLTLQRTTIRAPIDGVVVQKSAQIGQRVDPGQPLMSVTPLAQVYVDANFKEGQLRRVRIGQPVRLTSDLYGHHVVYHGRVTGLGGGTGAAFAVIPAQNATGNWIKVVQRVPVRISLDPRELAAHPLRVGLSMEAKIDVAERAASHGGGARSHAR